MKERVLYNGDYISRSEAERLLTEKTSQLKSLRPRNFGDCLVRPYLRADISRLTKTLAGALK